MLVWVRCFGDKVLALAQVKAQLRDHDIHQAGGVEALGRLIEFWRDVKEHWKYTWRMSGQNIDFTKNPKPKWCPFLRLTVNGQICSLDMALN